MVTSMKRKLLREVKVPIAERTNLRNEIHTWTIQFTTRRQMPKKTWGDCNRKLRRIRVRVDLSEQNMLDTLIHEIRHAQHPVMFEAEEFISDTSTEIAVALIATGRVFAFVGV